MKAQKDKDMDKGKSAIVNKNDGVQLVVRYFIL